MFYPAVVKKPRDLSKVVPTPEQGRIVAWDGHVAAIKARAGTGKTFTMELLAAAHPHDRILYLVYNRQNRLEAESRFPRHVTVHTNHSLAWGPVGSKYGMSGTGDLDPRSLLTMKPWSDHFKRVGQVKAVTDTLQNFLISADNDLMLSHIPVEYPLRYPPGHPRTRQQQSFGFVPDSTTLSAELVLNLARTLWMRAQDVKDTGVKMPHDGYLKKFALSNPRLPYDLILADEFQDTNELMLGLVMSQKDDYLTERGERRKGARIIGVGDDCQQIYGYRGAINALDSMGADTVMTLSHSHRFPQGIADLANVILRAKGETLMLSGRKDVQAEVHQDGSRFDTNVAHTYIARTNAGLLAEAMRIAVSGRRIHFAGGIKKYPIHLVDDAYNLYRGRYNPQVDAELKPYKTWTELKEHATVFRSGPEAILQRLIEKHKDKIPAMTQAVRDQNMEHPDQADVILTSAHKSKGLEWDVVRLADDYPNPYEERKAKPGEEDKPTDPEEEARKKSEEANLLYVAVTRSKRVIVLNQVVRDYVEQAGLQLPAREASARNALPPPVIEAEIIEVDTTAPARDVPLPVSRLADAPASGPQGPLEEWQEVSKRLIDRAPQFFASILKEIGGNEITEALDRLDAGQPVTDVLAALRGPQVPVPALTNGARR